MSEWIDVKDRIPTKEEDGIYMVKRSNGNEEKCYSHSDKMLWLSYWYKGELSNWQSYETRQFYFDVTHWMPLPELPKE